jgi:outer membrane autotransporter protein
MMKPDLKIRAGWTIGTAVVALVASYGRRAYAACAGPAPTYTCTGNLTTTQTIGTLATSPAPIVTTLAPFSVITVTGDAMVVQGTGTVSFTDTNASTLTGGGGRGIYVHGTGALAVNANGAITGSTYGIEARNDDFSAAATTTITVSGDVTGASRDGVHVSGVYGSSVSTAAGSNVTGAYTGIYMFAASVGAVSSINGNVTGQTGSGIVFWGTPGSALVTGPGTIRGEVGGITARAFQRYAPSPAFSITANGPVIGTTGDGIRVYSVAQNYGLYGGLSVTTGPAALVSGGTNGIDVSNLAAGAITIAADGHVTGANGDGIHAYAKPYIFNYGSGRPTNISITTPTGSSVTGGADGIGVENRGLGFTDITIGGDVAGATGDGVNVLNAIGSNFRYGGFYATPTDLAVTTGPDSAVEGGANGIGVENRGSGFTSITIGGRVTGTAGDGLRVLNAFGGNRECSTGYYGGVYCHGHMSATPTNLTITTNTGSTVTGGANGINAEQHGTGYTNIAVNGSVTALSGDGIHALASYQPVPSYYGQHTPPTDMTITTGPGSTVMGALNGIGAVNEGIGFTRLAIGGSVSGQNADGITATDAASATFMTITTQAGSSVSGAQSGIVADHSGTGPLTITADGNVTGSTAHGISAASGGNATTMDISIGPGSVTQGASDGVFASSTTGAISIANAGTIQNLSGNSADLAIATSGGAASIVNDHLVTGTVNLGDPVNSFVNNGTWNTAGGTNEFGTAAGNSVANAAGATIIAANNPSAAQVTTFNGLGTFTNAGTLTMQDGFAGDRTVINGNYVGQNGHLLFDTQLGADDSPTDQLHVTGDTSGTTNVQVANAGGQGALTTGDGIPLVLVDGVSNGVFTSTGRIEAGAYEYLLYKGGLAADAANGNWYLRSYFEEPCNGVNGGGNGGNGGGNGNGGNGGVCNGGNGGGEPEPGPVAWRPGVAGYVMTPALNLAYGFDMLGTLHTRVGDVPGAVAPGNANHDGVWGRIGGSNLQVNALDRFSADSSTFYAQFGKDWTLDKPQTGGSTHAGVTLSFGTASADFDDSGRKAAGLDSHTGTVSTQAQSLGGYWTRYLSDGTYFDSVGQVTHYHNRYGDIDGNSPGQDGFGFALSQEVGKPFQIASSQFAIEPQAQLMYQYLSLGNFSDTVSDISGTHTNALRGRLGFRIFRFGLQSADGKDTAIPWISANILHDFLPTGQTVIGGTPLTPNFARTWYDVGVGMTVTMAKRSELYANVRYLHSMGGQNGRAVTGQVGYRYSW